MRNWHHPWSAAVVPFGCLIAVVSSAAAQATDARTLKDAFRGIFLVGTALNDRQFSGRDTVGAALVRAQFNAISPENALKWEVVHPRPGIFDFSAADRYVDFGSRNGMFIVGHTLVWHSQVPPWVFQDSAGSPVSRDTLLGRMRDHIYTVVGRYKGRVRGWDVVNEALSEDGMLRPSPWVRIIGDDYIVKAFQFAHEADPGAQLYYNDYSLENAPKRNGAVALVTRLRAAGVPIAAVGSQSHVKMNWPSTAQYDSTILALAATGVRVNITELDVDVLPPATRSLTADVAARAEGPAAVNPYAAGLPDSVQRALAARYADLFRVFLAHREVIDRVTFWGVADGDSWLNNWPARGRTSYPLLFDRAGLAKPAFDAVMAVIAAVRPPGLPH